jgi:hypothetical protein
MSEQYQRGTLRKVMRASGKHVWQWRYRIKGVMKQESSLVVELPNPKVHWSHFYTRLKLLNVQN